MVIFNSLKNINRGPGYLSVRLRVRGPDFIQARKLKRSKWARRANSYARTDVAKKEFVLYALILNSPKR